MRGFQKSKHGCGKHIKEACHQAKIPILGICLEGRLLSAEVRLDLMCLFVSLVSPTPVVYQMAR